jgi:hypothetical protein
VVRCPLPPSPRVDWNFRTPRLVLATTILIEEEAHPCHGPPGGPCRPEELVLGLAAFCARSDVTAGEVVLHVFPFGGVRAGVEMLSKLRDGTWPQLY